MDTILMNSKNSETSGPHRLIVNLTDKMNFKRKEVINLLLYQILRIKYTWKNIKIHTNTINLKFQLRRRMMNLNYVKDHILYQIFLRLF